MPNDFDPQAGVHRRLDSLAADTRESAGQIREIRAMLTTYNEQLVQLTQRVSELVTEQAATDLLAEIHQQSQALGLYERGVVRWEAAIAKVLNGGRA